MDADREAEAEEAIHLRDALVAGLAGAASSLDDTARDLLRAATWLPWQKRLMLALVGMQTIIMAGLLVVGLVLLSYGHTNRDNTTATVATTERTQETLDAVESCTTPAGACYQRSQAQTATAIATLQRFTLIAVECAHSGTDAQIEACVLAKSRAQALVR